MAKRHPWTEAEIPSQDGKRVLITGANSGIGLATARALAARDAQVILACRSEEKARQAMADIREHYPRARLHFLQLDLANLSSVAHLAELFFEHYDRLDLLVNNAGVMWLPEGRTADGFERQLGTNHLGHFALTGRLLPALLKQPGSRVVTVSSLAHRGGRLNFDDLFFERHAYGKHRAYCQSKLANLVFALELDRRLNQAGSQTLSLAAHPGITDTNLGAPRSGQGREPLAMRLARKVSPMVLQSAAKGALPSLYAATAQAVKGGDYFGPDGPYEAFGYPAPAHRSGRARNPDIGRQLWQASEQLTGVVYPFPSQSAVA